ncbi:Uncharacterized protein TCM_001806 [Theobroma cacao]|uniref:Uncharacterized protein n=1 Tax=Theobroma cacao TaxID=3641 RepID=A0A061DSI2_THECC|nr:Uncharacterized protein TCM_001806 [Theobroma cacao]
MHCQFLILVFFSLIGTAMCKVRTNHNHEIAEELRKTAASAYHAQPANISSLDEFNWAKMEQKLQRFQVPRHFSKIPLEAMRLDPKGLHGRVQQTTFRVYIDAGRGSLGLEF